MMVKHIPIFLLSGCLLSISTFRVGAQSVSDSLAERVAVMNEWEQVGCINDNFYIFYTDSYERAQVLGDKALEISQKNHWQPQEALIRKNLGIVHYLKGDYENALNYYQTALNLYEQLADPEGQGEVLKEMGNYFKRIKEYDKALSLLERAVGLCSEPRELVCLPGALDIKGVILMELERLDEAEAIFQKEKALLLRTGDEKGLSYTYDNLAAIATMRGRYPEAIAFLANAIEIRRNQGDRQGVAISINNMGETLLQAGQPAAALPHFQEALKQSENIGLSDLRRHIMQMLSDTYAALHQPDAAMQWLQQSYALKDSLFNTERSRQLAEMAEKYEAEKKGKELARQQVQLQQRNSQLYLSGLGLAALVVVFGFVFRQQRLKQLQLQREAVLKDEIAQADVAKRLQDERLRISRDLHDHLGAELTIIGSALSRRQLMATAEPEKQELGSIRANAGQAMEQLRETIWAIRQERFTLRDLADKINDFAGRATALPVQISLPDAETALTPSQTLNLYRIAQEAIINMVKHAGASHINIVFSGNPQQLQLSLSDDGQGFDPGNKSGGHGLANMRARASELGGNITVQTSPGAGTQLLVELPL